MSKRTPELIQTQLPFDETGLNPSGLCMCGCGQPAPLALQTDTKRGYVKDQPLRFIIGHYNYVRPKRPVIERFLEKVNKDGPIHPVLGTACWLWTGLTDRRGYGTLSIDSRHVPAHRISYTLYNGEIPEGLFVCHHCDRPQCVRPDHLFTGTQDDNMKDCHAKGRYAPARGERASKARFTNQQVRELRRDFAEGNYTITEFARLHDLSHSAMKAILNRVSYQDA